MSPPPFLPAPAVWPLNPEQGDWRARAAVVGGVLLAHVVAGWALLQVEAVRQAVVAVAPVMVSLVTEQPEPPPPAPPPPPPPPPEPVRLKTPPPPKPVIAAAPRPEPRPEPPVFAAPPAPPEPPPPEQVAVEAPPAPLAPPAPPAPPAPSPKLISASEIVCPTPAAPAYPDASVQRGEEGTALVRVLIDAQGRPQDAALHRSSGHPRLDRAALAGVRSLRCRPYTEAGVAQAVWVVAPIDFQLQ